MAKDFSLLDRSAQGVSAAVPLCVRTGDVYAEGVKRGIGGDNITGIVQLYAQVEN